VDISFARPSSSLSARYSPQAIIAAIEDTTLIAKLKARLFERCWSILRYSHQGQRVVRLALEVTCHPGARPTFKLYYRTRGMTHQNVKATIVAHGSLIVLKGSQHAMFLGQEERMRVKLCRMDTP
jgi:hypothetical protein